MDRDLRTKILSFRRIFATCTALRQGRSMASTRRTCQPQGSSDARGMQTRGNLGILDDMEARQKGGWKRVLGLGWVCGGQPEPVEEEDAGRLTIGGLEVALGPQLQVSGLFPAWELGPTTLRIEPIMQEACSCFGLHRHVTAAEKKPDTSSCHCVALCPSS